MKNTMIGKFILKTKQWIEKNRHYIFPISFKNIAMGVFIPIAILIASIFVLYLVILFLVPVAMAWSEDRWQGLSSVATITGTILTAMTAGISLYAAIQAKATTTEANELIRAQNRLNTPLPDLYFQKVAGTQMTYELIVHNKGISPLRIDDIFFDEKKLNSNEHPDDEDKKKSWFKTAVEKAYTDVKYTPSHTQRGKTFDFLNSIREIGRAPSLSDFFNSIPSTAKKPSRIASFLNKITLNPEENETLHSTNNKNYYFNVAYLYAHSIHDKVLEAGEKYQVAMWEFLFERRKKDNPKFLKGEDLSANPEFLSYFDREVVSLLAETFENLFVAKYSTLDKIETKETGKVFVQRKNQFQHDLKNNYADKYSDNIK